MNVRKIILDIYRAQRSVPFAWNASDDCLGVAAAVAQAMTGRDPIAHLRGRYDSEQSAKRVMVEEGWRSMGDVAAAIFPQEIPVAQARAGDWLYVVNPDQTETIGVAVNERFMAKGKGGVEQGLLSHASRAFRVE
ncbi:MAG: hypothetical protein J0H17_10005 [Rhizobiales bacterium]|nr:hypothetical protein [Hyphomicrobiales bacterium]